MGALYDQTKEDLYILYIDVNNYYGWGDFARAAEGQLRLAK